MNEFKMRKIGLPRASQNNAQCPLRELETENVYLYLCATNEMLHRMAAHLIFI